MNNQFHKPTLLFQQNNNYCKVQITDRHGDKRWISVNGYLMGLLLGFQHKKANKFFNMVLIDGTVGSGKSTLAQTMAGVEATLYKQQLTFENMSWTTENFVANTDRDDNFYAPLVFDEAIQGATAKSMAITSIGDKLKKAVVTKRFKMHTMYLLIDEINEYSWKLIKMADAFIHVMKFGVKRGYFNAYVNKHKIRFIYNAFKYYNKTWNSKEVRQIKPDCRGLFPDYSDVFLDSEQYDKEKLEQTRQIEDEGKILWDVKKTKAFAMWAKGDKKQIQIAREMNINVNTFNTWVAKEFRPLTSAKQ